MRAPAVRWRRAASPVVLCVALLAAPAATAEPVAPAPPEGSGWIVAGSCPRDYAVQLEPEGGRAGTLAASLRTVANPPCGFVTLMRWIPPGEHLGGRVRLSAWVKAEGVGDWAGLWMRVDSQERGRILAFDNMRDRPIRGTTGWRRYEVVLDVSSRAARVNYGVLLFGPGEVWVDEFEIEAVGPEVPVTHTMRPGAEPENLDFDHPPESPP